MTNWQIEQFVGRDVTVEIRYSLRGAYRPGAVEAMVGKFTGERSPGEAWFFLFMSGQSGVWITAPSVESIDGVRADDMLSPRAWLALLGGTIVFLAVTALALYLLNRD